MRAAQTPLSSQSSPDDPQRGHESGHNHRRTISVDPGSNDVTHATGMRELTHDTREMLHDSARRADVVVLGGSGRLDTRNFHRPLRDLVMWRARAVRRMQRRAVRDLAPDRFGFVDIGGAVGDEYARTKGASSSDGFHPAAPGYAVWARALGREVASRLPDGDGAQRPD